MKRLISVVLLITLFSGIIVIPSPAAADTPQIDFVPQIKLISPEANTRGTPMSADGRFTVFESSASDLVENDTNGYPDIFVYDRIADNITRVNVSSAGEEANFGYASNPGYPTISADGRYVAFASPAWNLVPEDTDSNYDIFVHDMQSGNTTLASVNSDGIKQNKSSEYNPVISMSADGRYITFNSRATNLAEGITGQYPPDQVYVHDMQSGNTTLVSVSTDGVVGNSSSTRSRISADGRYIVFQSFATNLVEGDTNDTEDIFVHDMVTGVTARVSVSSSGEEADGRNTNPIISGNGRYVYYVSEANNLVPDDASTDRRDVYAYDMETGDTTMVNKDKEGLQARGDDWFISTTYDGRNVAMTTDAWTNGGWGTGASHEWYYIADCVFVKDMETASITQVSMPYVTSVYPSYRDVQANGASYAGTISADGNYVSFISFAYNLIPDDPYGRGSKLFYAYVDKEPPTWPEGSSLRAENVGQTMLTLNWDPAEDEGRIYSYVLHGDEKLESIWGSSRSVNVPGNVMTYEVSGLVQNTEYTFWVEATDGWRGNVSDGGPECTVRTQAEGGTAVLQVTPYSGGLAYLNWDPAAPGSGATGFRVYRSGGGQASALVGSIPDVNTLTFQDSGLYAQTNYTYQVFIVDSGDMESPHTAPVEVTTPALQEISGITWQAPRENRLAILGETARIMVYGEANRQVEVEIGYKTWHDDGHNLLTEPRLTSTTVPLSQYTADSGQYHGDFPIEDGITEIRALSASLSDGAGHTVTRDMSLSPYERVGGAIVVDVIAEPDSLDGTRLIAWSDIAGTGTEVTPTGTGTYVLPGLKTSDDYAVRILRDDGRALAAQYNVAVTAGLETNLTMAPESSAWLHLQVQDEEGAGIENTLVTFNDAATGEYLGWNRTDVDGWLTALDEALSNDTVKATVRAELPYSGTTAEITMNPGENTIVLQLERLPEGTITGTVTDPDGSPTSGTIVTASQTIDGRAFNRRTNTDTNGQYSLTLLEGQARLEAANPASNNNANAKVVNITANGTLTQDFQLDGLGTGTISVVLNAHFLGEDPRPLDMDWPTALKFNIQVNGTLAVGSGYPFVVRGTPGDSVEVTVDGTWCNLPIVTQTVILDENYSATATFYLVETGARVQGTVYYNTGEAATGWYAGLYIADSTGRWSSYMAPGVWISSDETLEVGIRESGQYRVRVEPPYPWPQIYQALGQLPPVTVIEFTVTESQVTGGEIINLGDIIIDVRPFTGSTTVTTPGSSQTWEEPVAERTSFVALRDRVAPGGQVTYRANYRNVGSLTAYEVTMLLDIPRDTALIPGSVTTRIGQLSANLTGNTLEVPLGSIRPGETGYVYYQIRLPADMGAQTLIATGTMRWRDGASMYFLEESIGKAEVEVLGVTMNAPRMITDLNVALSGQAPADSGTVRVYDQNVLLGESPVSTEGYWQLTMELPYTGSPAWHGLRAEIESGIWGTLYSKQVAVLYDPEQPELEKMIFTQLRYDDHVILSREIIPSAGIARFPIAFHAGEILKFELQFDRPELIGQVKVKMQGTAGGIADAVLEDDDIFRAYIEIGEGTLGPISFSYKKKPSPEIFKQPWPSSEEKLRWQMPYPDKETVIDYDSAVFSDSKDEFFMSTNCTLPGFDCQMDIKLERDPAFTPTAAEIEYAEISGIPVYRMNTDYAVNSDNITGSLTAWIPEEAVRPDDPILSQPVLFTQTPVSGATSVIPLLDPITVLPASGESTFVKITSNWIFRGLAEGGMGGGDMALDLRNLAGIDGNFEQFEEMLDRINDNCDDCLTCAEQLQEKLDSLVLRWAIYQGAGVLLNAGGVVAAVLAPESFGLSLTYFGVKTSLGLSMDYNIGELTRMLSDEIDARCPPDESDEETPSGFDEWDWTVADPVWIFDPSGYVYEVTPDNRLQDVTATILYQDPDTNDWIPWDATWFGQMNPLITDVEGKYAWDVPEGNWKVVYEKDGYETAFSNVLPVPPPQLDVNIPMNSLEPPEIIGFSASPGGTGIEISFDKFVRAATLTDTTVTVYPAGSVNSTINGTLSTAVPVMYGSGEVSRSFFFTPQTFLIVGQEYTLRVKNLVQSYSGQPMMTDYERTIIIPPAPEPTPPSGGGGSGGTDDKRFTIVSTSATADGVLWEEVIALSVDAHLELVLQKGTSALNANGYPLFSITVATLADPGAPPENAAFIGNVYALLPEGTTFDPPAILNIYYDEADLPSGVSKANLCIHTFNEDTGVWEPLDCTIDTERNCVSCFISHFSDYAIIAGTSLAAFSVSGLSITPDIIDAGDDITVTVIVSNTGDLEGAYEAVLKIDGETVRTRSVSVPGGESIDLSFSFTASEAGTFSLTIGQARASLTVVQPVTTPTPSPTPTSTQPAPEVTPEPTLTATTTDSEIEPELTGTIAAVSTEDAEQLHENDSTENENSFPMAAVIGGGIVIVGLISTIIIVRKRKS